MLLLLLLLLLMLLLLLCAILDVVFDGGSSTSVDNIGVAVVGISGIEVLVICGGSFRRM